MRKEFSTKWIGSKQPRKQRKYVYNAPLHTRHKLLSAHLSKDLRTKYGKRSVPVRKGDEVLVMRGNFKKKKAKITGVNLKRGKVFLENIQRTKKDGSKVNVPFYPSNLMITSLALEDKERIALLNRNGKAKVDAKIETKAERKVEGKK
jgi:large subunit ribosomal protein L24